MKITTFNPLIFTKDAKPLIELFEALGFERTHTKEDIDSENTTDFRMKDANGFHVDITQTNKVKEDRCSIRMNVDNLMRQSKNWRSTASKAIRVTAPWNRFFDSDHHEVPQRILHQRFGA